MRRFGNYELVALLSQGGMAEIFHAKLHRASGFVKDVALKKILPEHNRNEEFVHLFVNEARVAARLHHANVVQVFDFGEVEGEYFIAMELVKGKDLRKLLKATLQKDRPLSLPLSTHIMTQTLKGLSYAHEAADGDGVPLTIIHRDITPHNLLISRRGEVKISDFGIAKAAFTTGITAQGMVRGKLGYMSPEQVTGQPLSQKTDLFSAGAIFYEMFTGQRLYKGRAGRKLVQQIAQGDPPDPKTLSATPSALRDLVLNLLDRHPDKRPTAREALEAIHAGGWSVDSSLELSRFLSRLDGNDSDAVAAQPNPPNLSKKVPLSSTLKGTPQQRPRALDISPPNKVVKPALPQKPSLSDQVTVLLPPEEDASPAAPASQTSADQPPSSATPPLREQKTLLLEDSDEPLSAAFPAGDSEKAAKKTVDLPSKMQSRLILRVALVLSATLSALFFGYAVFSTLETPSFPPKKKSPLAKDASFQSSFQGKKKPPKKPWGRLRIPKNQEPETVYLDGLPVLRKAHRDLYVPAGVHLIQRARKGSVSPPVQVKVIPKKTSR